MSLQVFDAANAHQAKILKYSLNENFYLSTIIYNNSAHFFSLG